MILNLKKKIIKFKNSEVLSILSDDLVYPTSVLVSLASRSGAMMDVLGLDI